MTQASHTNTHKIILSGLVILAGLPIAEVALANGTNRTLLAQKRQPQVIKLTQVACQFLESESKDYNFVTKKAADCKTANNKNVAERKKGFKPMRLKAGEYVFRVSNTEVPYELGFYLRGAGISGAALPRLSGGGLTQGKTLDYKVTLKPGTYVYSCPLNPTPDYPLIVE